MLFKFTESVRTVKKKPCEASEIFPCCALKKKTTAFLYSDEKYKTKVKCKGNTKFQRTQK